MAQTIEKLSSTDDHACPFKYLCINNKVDNKWEWLFFNLQGFRKSILSTSSEVMGAVSSQCSPSLGMRNTQTHISQQLNNLIGMVPTEMEGLWGLFQLHCLPTDKMMFSIWQSVYIEHFSKVLNFYEYHGKQTQRIKIWINSFKIS